MKIFRRGKRWSFRHTHEGKQIWVSLRTDNKGDGETRKAQFLVTLKNSGWEAAMAELKGKRVLKKGESPTHADIERLYREFMGQSRKPVSEKTVIHNLACLRRLMAICNAADVGSFDPSKLKWTKENTSNLSAQIRAARSIFKNDALAFWEKCGVRLCNPFAKMGEKEKPRRAEYTPIAQECRERILNDLKELPARQQMIVHLALGAGLRRGEIDAARVTWLTKQKTNTVLTVKSGYGFKTKSGKDRSILIPHTLADQLAELRKSCVIDKADPFLIPSGSNKVGKIRLDAQFRAILPWLAERGITEVKALHGLRREAGSVVATAHGMLQAQKFLGHASIVTTESYYANLTRSETIDTQGLIFGKSADLLLEAAAKALGTTVEQLKALKTA